MFLCVWMIATRAMTPLLFMDMHDVSTSPAPWGKLQPRANGLAVDPALQPPPGNFTGGDTVFAAFEVLGAPGTYEVFMAVGRPASRTASPSAPCDRRRRGLPRTAMCRGPRLPRMAMCRG